GSTTHATKDCSPAPETVEEVKAVGWNQFVPSSNPTLRYGNNQCGGAPPQRMRRPQEPNQQRGPSLGDTLQAMMRTIQGLEEKVVQTRQSTDSTVDSIQRQLSQLAEAMSKLESKSSGHLPSQVEANPKGSGKAK